MSRLLQIALGTLLVHVAIGLWLAEQRRGPDFLRQKIRVATVVLEREVATPVATKRREVAPAKPVAPRTNKQLALQAVRSAMNAISEPSLAPPTKPELKAPVLCEVPVGSKASSTHEEIALLLQNALELPEFGEVKVLLSIDRSGKLQSLQVIDAKSAKNASFLTNRLPELQFPCLNEAVSLTVVFSNAL